MAGEGLGRGGGGEWEGEHGRVGGWESGSEGERENKERGNLRG